MRKPLYINGRFLTQKITGVQRYAIEIVKCMDEIVSEGEEVIILIPPEEQVNRLELKKIKQIVVGSFKGHLWIQISLPNYVKKHGGDLLTFAGLAPVIMPGYWTIHDITFIRHPESFDWKFRVLYGTVLRAALNRCKKIFTVSNFSKNEISNYFGISKEKIKVAYSSANYLLSKEYDHKDLAKYGVKGNDYYLSVSSRNKHKNQVFIEKLAKRYPDKKFLIAGGNVKSFITIKTESLTNLIYIGYVEDDTLVELYKNAIGFIFPSLYEGFGLPPLESIIAGCQSIALSDIPVFREIYYDSAYFFDVNNIESFSFEQFENKIVSDTVRDRYIEKYSFEKDAEIYLKCIDLTYLGECHGTT